MFILSAKQNGKVVYWTGKAGDGWVSENKADAWPCSAEYAASKVKLHNRFSDLHGLTFQAEHGLTFRAGG